MGLWLALCTAAAPAHARDLVLDGRAAIDVWHSVTLLADADNAYTAAQLVAQPQRFQPPTGTARTLAAPLELAPGHYVLLLRVQTLTSLVLPITVRTPEAFMRYELQVQLVQGVIVGLALCMLMYSLAHWFSLRDAVFLDYALLLAGNSLFGLTYFGIGPLWLWPEWPALYAQTALIGLLVTVVAGTRFARATLQVRQLSVLVDRALGLASGAAVLGLVGSITGWLDYRSTQSLVTVLGTIVTLIVLPTAATRLYRGDRIAGYMLFGWGCLSVGTLVMAGIVRGVVEPSFLAQHVYPISTMLEMAAWMALLG